MTRLALRRRESEEKELVRNHERTTTIHWRARARGFTSDDIEEGTPCTVKLACWTEGAATVVRVHRAKDGRVWKLAVRPEFTSTAGRYGNPWVFVRSYAPAGRHDGHHSFAAFRYGNKQTNPSTWEHRRLLVGHSDARNPDLTDAICALHLPAPPDQAHRDLVASFEGAIHRFLQNRGFPHTKRDTESTLLNRVETSPLGFLADDEIESGYDGPMR